MRRRSACIRPVAATRCCPRRPQGCWPCCRCRRWGPCGGACAGWGTELEPETHQARKNRNSNGSQYTTPGVCKALSPPSPPQLRCLPAYTHIQPTHAIQPPCPSTPPPLHPCTPPPEVHGHGHGAPPAQQRAVLQLRLHRLKDLVRALDGVRRRLRAAEQRQGGQHADAAVTRGHVSGSRGGTVGVCAGPGRSAIAHPCCVRVAAVGVHRKESGAAGCCRRGCEERGLESAGGH